MKKQGKTIKSRGSYSIVELVESLLDGSNHVLGYNIIGPNTDITWIYDLAQANLKFDELAPEHAPNKMKL